VDRGSRSVRERAIRGFPPGGMLRDPRHTYQRRADRRDGARRPAGARPAKLRALFWNPPRPY